MSRMLGVSTETVLPLGGLGCFDEHGIFPINVFRDGDRVLAYTTGWNRKVSVSADAAIGLAISHDDGLSFQRYGTGPVMAASLHEPFLVARCVRRPLRRPLSHVVHLRHQVAEIQRNRRRLTGCTRSPMPHRRTVSTGSGTAGRSSATA